VYGLHPHSCRELGALWAPWHQKALGDQPFSHWTLVGTKGSKKYHVWGSYIKCLASNILTLLTFIFILMDLKSYENRPRVVL